MLNDKLRRLAMGLAAAAYGSILLGGAARDYGGTPSVFVSLLENGHRMASIIVSVLALVLFLTIRRALSGRTSASMVALVLVLLPILSLIKVSIAPYFGIAVTVLATWLVMAVFDGGEGFRSRLSMFRSQWQVPLYAALALYLVTVLGTYLKSLGSEAACHSWPLCQAPFETQLSGVFAAHLAHRLAVLIAGACLIYTVNFVWRRHQHRPILLVLTGSAVILYTIQVLVGAQAARAVLGPLGGVAHLGIAIALICTLVALTTVGFYAPSLPEIAGAEVAVMAPVRPPGEVAHDYFATFKPRLVVLLLITGYAAMWVAAKGAPSLPLTLVTMLGLGLSSGAANAINMWYDTDIDGVMKRTRNRPIPSGRLTPSQVLAFGILMGALSFIILAFAVNLLTALLSLFGLLFYVCIYTMWLKRSTDLNTVIGGICGAVPPLVGWAAVTGELSWAPLAMFLIMFMWQPPHFWALALYRNEDYRAAKIPMLPVTKGEMHTKWMILLYTVALFPTVMSLYWTGVVGKAYLWVSIGAIAVYLVANLILLFERLPVAKWARKSFFWSLYWLAFVFLVMVLDIKK